MAWQRPTSAPYPAVYARCVGRRPDASGKVPKFRIQDAPPEMEKEVVQHMVTFFTKSEPTCSVHNFADDPVSIKEVTALWTEVFRQHMTLVALQEEEDGTTRLAGVNMTVVSEAKDKNKEYHYEGIPMQAVLHNVHYFSNLVDVFERYGVNEYLTAMGLSVAPEFQGQGLGLQILLARIPLCRATGLKLTATVFTAAVSQELAKRAGFEMLAEVEYKDIKVDGKELFPGIKTKFCTNMALRIEQ